MPVLRAPRLDRVPLAAVSAAKVIARIDAAFHAGDSTAEDP